MSTPSRIEVSFGERDPPIVCASVQEMDAALDRLHAACDPDQPICVTIAIPGYWVHIGLGSDPTFVMIQVEPFDGEYYLSVGDPAATGWKDYYGCGNHTPFERSSFVSLWQAREAVREFVATQRRSPVIAWQDWDGKPV